MKPFYTITDQNTEHTNSRSKRFDSFNEAKDEAGRRLQRRDSTGMIIMKAVALVTSSDPVPPPPPVFVVPFEEDNAQA